MTYLTEDFHFIYYRTRAGIVTSFHDHSLKDPGKDSGGHLSP